MTSSNGHYSVLISLAATRAGLPLAGTFPGAPSLAFANRYWLAGRPSTGALARSCVALRKLEVVLGHNELDDVGPFRHRSHPYERNERLEQRVAESEREERERTDVSARQRLPDRPVDFVPQFILYHRKLLRRERVREHVRVHRWEEVDGDEGGQGAKEGSLERAGRQRSAGGLEGGERERTRMLSQIPCVILARVLAEQGAMRMMSAQRRSCNGSGTYAR